MICMCRAHPTQTWGPQGPSVTGGPTQKGNFESRFPKGSGEAEGKIHRVDPDFGSTLTVSNRDFQSNCWVKWKIMGQTCEFQVLPRRLKITLDPPACGAAAADPLGGGSAELVGGRELDRAARAVCPGRNSPKMAFSALCTHTKTQNRFDMENTKEHYMHGRANAPGGPGQSQKMSPQRRQWCLDTTRPVQRGATPTVVF